MGLSNSFKGFETIFASVRMFWQMSKRLILLLLVIQILFISGVIYYKGIASTDATDMCLIRTYYINKLISVPSFTDQNQEKIDYPCEGPVQSVSKKEFYDTFGVYVEQKVNRILYELQILFYKTSVIYIVYILLLVYFSRKHKENTQDKFIRGARLISSEQLGKLIAKKFSNSELFDISNDVKLPLDIITRHTICLGKPGSGKTQLISRIIKQMIKRNYRAIIHDFKGDFISTFYDHKQHLIFNPLDKRHMGLKDKAQDLIQELKGICVKDLEPEYAKQLLSADEMAEDIVITEHYSFNELLDIIEDISNHILPTSKFKLRADEINSSVYPVHGWSLLNELKSPIDIDAFCASLIPESASSDNFWPISSRQLLGAIITYCIYHDILSYEELWKLVNLDNEQLLEMFKTTPGCEEGVKLLTEGKTANNILAVLSNYTKPIKYLLKTEGNFSIKSWVRNDRHSKRIIFLSNSAMIQETIRPFLTLFVDFSTKTLCSLPDNLDRRLHFVLDEFGQLSKIGSIIQLLTQSRSKGGATYILIQDVSQISSTYGQEGCNSIVNSCGNLISFAVKDKEAEFIAKSFGSKEVRKTDESRSMGVDDLKDSISISAQTVEKQLVLPSEITNLPTLTYYIQLTDFPVARDKLNIISFKSTSESYIGREDLLLKAGKKSAKQVVEVSSVDSSDQEKESESITESYKTDDLFAELIAIEKENAVPFQEVSTEDVADKTEIENIEQLDMTEEKAVEEPVMEPQNNASFFVVQNSEENEENADEKRFF